MSDACKGCFYNKEMEFRPCRICKRYWNLKDYYTNNDEEKQRRKSFFKIWDGTFSKKVSKGGKE